jgi:aryl-alcohol dehydrogenase-like predicted oxidoreductase
MMEYAKLGRTGLEVSRICLGCMSYGVPDRGNHAWSIDEAESRPFIKRALEAGINFFDTANRYSLGNPRTGDQGFHAPRRGRHRHQSLWTDAAGTQWQRLVAQGDYA